MRQTLNIIEKYSGSRGEWLRPAEVGIISRANAAAGVLMLDARKDPQTVTADGQRVERLIEGVVVRNAVTHEDDRGELSEIFNPAWGVTSDPLVYVYQAMIRPGKLKGWVYHEHQEDRIFLSCGFLKWVLCDCARIRRPTR
jgi:dTDP-4-dehydrorhamnose 3,5-epimerase